MEILHSASHKLASSSMTNASNKEYQTNVKLFIQNVEQEVSSLIHKYQTKISQLKNQNERLKRQLHKEKPSSPKINQNIECFSPIKQLGNSYVSNTAQSNIFNLLPSKTLFSTQIKQSSSLQKNPQRVRVEEIPNNLVKSRFEIKSKIEKRRQQQIVQSLEMGRSNLNLNTTKLFTLIGRQNDEKGNPENEEIELQSPLKNKKSQALNTSLSSLCESLDNSFHAKKSRAKKASKQKQKQKDQKGEEQRKKEQEKVKKEQGVKNLLQSLRNNINSSPQKPPEIIKGNKLLNTGGKQKVKLVNKSKVMINPVPVEIDRRESRKGSMSPVLKKNPQSILKNSNILTRSISNISAISFHSSGGQQ